MNRIRTWGAAVLAAGILLLPSPAMMAERPLPTISISGTGVVTGAPDQAMISLGVVTHADTAEAAQTRNAAAARGIRDAVTALGVDRRYIQTSNYSFRPEYSREQNDRREIVGYVVSNTVAVRLDDVDMVGQVIDAALTSGANTVDSLTFSIRDTRGLRREALAAAVKDAREKAEIIAGALGKRLAGIQSVTENSQMFQPRMDMNKMMMSAAAEATPIEAGSLSLEAAVHIEFILAD